MAQRTIPELPSLSGTPAAGDLLHIVDISDATESVDGTSKQVRREDLVGGKLEQTTYEVEHYSDGTHKPVTVTTLKATGAEIVTGTEDAKIVTPKAIKDAADSLVTLTDVTTNNVSTTKHGFAPKLPGNTTTFLRGDGQYAAPAISGVAAQDRSTSQTSVTNTTTETTIYSYTVPGGTLGTSNMLRLTIWGQYLNNTGGARTLTIKVKYGATTVADETRATNADAANQDFKLEAFLMAAGATNSQKGGFVIHGANVNQIFSNASYGTAAEDSTASKTLTVTVTHDSASANCTFNKEVAILELL